MGEGSPKAFLISFLTLGISIQLISSAPVKPHGNVRVRSQDLVPLPHQWRELIAKDNNTNPVNRIAATARAVLSKYLGAYSSTDKGQGLFVTDSTTLQQKLNLATNKSGRQVTCRDKVSHRNDTIVVISMIIRYAGRFLQQWLTYYFDLGVNHVFLYVGADFDEDGTTEAVRPFMDIGFVSLFMHPGISRQRATFRRTFDLMRRKACSYTGRGTPEDFPDCPAGMEGEDGQATNNNRTIWVGGVDDDEYLVMRKEDLCMHDLLSSFNEQRHVGAVLAHWEYTLTEHHDLLQPSKGSREVLLPASFKNWGKSFLKVITGPLEMELMVHNARFKDPTLTTVDSLGHRTVESHFILGNETAAQLWVLVHRRYPSFEGAMWQWMRGKHTPFGISEGWASTMSHFLDQRTLGHPLLEDTLASQRAVLGGK